MRHDGPHWSKNPEAYRPPVSRDLAAKLAEIAKEGAKRLEKLNLKVLRAMGEKNGIHEQRPPVVTKLARTSTAKEHAPDLSTTMTKLESPYRTLHLSGRQIRLFELHPGTEASEVEGSFHYIPLSSCPVYTAVSYAWGDQRASRHFTLIGGGRLCVRENL